jgi:hypothetical protein
MKIRVGYEVAYQSPQPTPMVLTLRVHPSRAADLVIPDPIVTTPPIAIGEYHDSFGNICSRIVAPTGRLTLSTEAIVRDNGETDVVASSAGECAIADLPAETLLFLLGSRYCETDLLSETAWSLFGNTRAAGGGSRRSAILCTAMSALATSTRTRPRRRSTCSQSARACVATLPTSPSPCAAV